MTDDQFTGGFLMVDVLANGSDTLTLTLEQAKALRDHLIAVCAVESTNREGSR